MRELPALEKPLAEMGAAEDIEAVRRGFALLSEEMAVVLRTFGLEGDAAVYRLRCPMAFNNRGAFWLQADREIRNPYFGAVMPRCGEVVERIPPTPADTSGGEPDGARRDE
jgi:Cu(I)/Ag(I) efflux system membrane fusion protein